ncbi:hypothetical protein GU243_10905 [Pseudarthrobacter psychrotolerans]|uniref:Uncharacterized protein n=1 Tax=Pseudarthrobacter psychrotolerans TaxID=2697569 RepID=A0A6P1NLH1_9MICC|nr:hypothetical protein [Pseudarthrobacter psychrotolerans]QHK20158.1 hypothetical protein GU243_10905 [Pseudarthrobacter psychrotolerans]
MNLQRKLGTSMPGYDEPGEAGVCPACGHTPTKHYRLTRLDKLLKAAKSTQHCTAKDDATGPSGLPEVCMCHNSYHLGHFL